MRILGTQVFLHSCGSHGAHVMLIFMRENEAFHMSAEVAGKQKIYVKIALLALALS